MRVIQYEQEFREDFLDLYSEWEKEYFGEREKRHEDSFEDPEEVLKSGAAVFLAIGEGKADAFCIAGPSEGDAWEICGLFTAGQMRNKGAGKAVFDAAMEHAAGSGAKKLIIRCAGGRKEALHIFEGSGFRKAECLEAGADSREIVYEKNIFRPMRRFRQQITRDECIRILKEEPRGVLSVTGDNGYPYGVVLDHWYCEEDGRLYFHGAKTGHKLDAIRKNDKVSYLVWDKGYRKEGEWALNIKSVSIFGRMKLVTDEEKAREICTCLCRKFTDDEEYLQKELKSALPRVQCLELTIEHMSGKLVNES